MRLLFAILLSCLAISSISSVVGDGQGQYNNHQAQQQANVDRQNTITLTTNQGVAITSRSLTYTPGSNNVLGYDQVDIVTGIFPDDKKTGKLEIQIDNLNVTQSGMAKKPNLQVQQFAFAWRPFSIVQYVETATQQNGFDANDTLCHEYEIRPSLKGTTFAFKWISSNVTQGVNGTATTITTFEGTSSDNVFKIILHAAGATSTNTAQTRAKAVWIGGRFVSPTSIKFDVAIDVNQPGFKLNTSAACTKYQIAIKSWARSMQDVFARTTTAETVNGTNTTTATTKITNLDRIQTGGDANPFGFFTWATTATVTTYNSTNQTTTKVLATSLLKQKNDEDHDALIVTKQAVHSFDAIRPGIIQWDPEFGSDSANPDMPNTATPTPTNSTTPTNATPTSSTPTDPTATTSPPTGTGTGVPTTPGRNMASTTTFSMVTMIMVVMGALLRQ